jgi:hypothetical protein
MLHIHKHSHACAQAIYARTAWNLKRARTLHVHKHIHACAQAKYARTAWNTSNAHASCTCTSTVTHARKHITCTQHGIAQTRTHAAHAQAQSCMRASKIRTCSCQLGKACTHAAHTWPQNRMRVSRRRMRLQTRPACMHAALTSTQFCMRTSKTCACACGKHARWLHSQQTHTYVGMFQKHAGSLV